MTDDARAALDALIRERGEDYSSISRLLGRNPAYIQQFIKRGTPKRLPEDDRARLAAYFRVPEARLGGRGVEASAPPAGLVPVPRIDVGASAGPGGIAEIEERGRPFGFDAATLRRMGAGRPEDLSIIRVAGDSMEPTLRDGDDILVDRSDTRVRAGVFVLRLDDVIVVKRLRPLRTGTRPFAIVSDNEAYPVNADFDLASTQVIGRVLWCGRAVG